MPESTRTKIRPKVPYVLSVLRLLALPAVGVILLQCLSAYQQNFDESVFYSPDWFHAIGSRFLWNYLILLILYLILYSLPFFRTTSIILNTAVFLFALSEHYVILFRNTIIFPWDLAGITLAVKVSGTYDFAVTKEVVCSILLFACMVFLSFVGKEPRFRVWLRALFVTVFLLSGFGFMTQFVMSKDAQAKTGIHFYYTIINYNYENGVLMNFGYHLRFVFPDKPSGYSAASVKEELQAYGASGSTSDSKALTDGSAVTPASTPSAVSVAYGSEKPDVIMVMSEAFSDLRNIGSYKTSEPVMPYWDSLSGNNVIKKTLLTSSYGGNTANSEFEVLTGMTMQFFPSGTYPFKQYIRNNVTSVASLLKDKGYETMAVHPFDLTGWNRKTVMPLLGFDSLTGEDAFKAADRYRSYVSDQSSYQYIIDQYESHKSTEPETPLFEYLITIQNHGGYAYATDLPYDITAVIPSDTQNTSDTAATDSSFAADSSSAEDPKGGQSEEFSYFPQAAQYFSLLRISDDALKMLISYFAKIDHPTVIILYGDHLPNLNDGFMDELNNKLDMTDPQNFLKRFETNILVWANYDISQSMLAAIEEPYISNNYVSTYLSDILGVPQTPFQKFLFQMHEYIPVLNASYIVDKKGKVYNYDYKDIPADLKAWIDKYKYFQYYEMYDAAK